MGLTYNWSIVVNGTSLEISDSANGIFYSLPAARITVTKLGSGFVRINMLGENILLDIYYGNVSTPASTDVDDLITKIGILIAAAGGGGGGSANITQTITNGDLLNAPSGDAVYDALAALSTVYAPITSAITPFTSLTIAGSTTINATNLMFANFYATSSLTACAVAFSNFPNGSTITLDYLKTTATNLAITFPVGSIISVSGNCTVASNVATLLSTTSGRFTITIVNVNGTYKIYIVQDIA